MAVAWAVVELEVAVMAEEVGAAAAVVAVAKAAAVGKVEGEVGRCMRGHSEYPREPHRESKSSPSRPQCHKEPASRT